MNVSELIKLNKSDQENWLNENIGDLNLVAFDGEPVGYIIHCDDNSLEEYIKYPEDHEIGSMIKSVFSEISSMREQELNAGAKITTDEKKYLRDAVAKELSQDEFQGDNYTVCDIELGNATIFVTFSCKLVPYASWEFTNIHETKEKAIQAIKTLSENEYFYPI